MAEKPIRPAPHQAARNLIADIPAPTKPALSRAEIDRHLGRHLIDAERREKQKRGIK